MVKWITITAILGFLLLGSYNVSDVREAISYYGSSISSSHPGFGTFIFFLAILFLIFPNEIISNIVKAFGKVKIKQNF